MTDNPVVVDKSTCIAINFFFFQAEDGIRDPLVTGVTCALPILGQNPKAKKSSKRVGTTTSGAVTWNEYEHVAAQNAANYGRNVYHVTASVDPHCAMPIAA